jgi:hypothetical protein
MGDDNLNWELQGECYLEGLELEGKYLLKEAFEDIALGLI